MDARAAELPLNRNDFASWLARERASGRVSRYATLGVAGALLVATVGVQRLAAEPRRAARDRLLSPPLIALLLIANLIPAIVLMVLYSRAGRR